MRALPALVLMVCCAVGTMARADGVVLAGTIGNRAILLVNSSDPKTVAPGETFQGVRLVSLQDAVAVVEYGGKRLTLHMNTPVSIGGNADVAGSGKRIVLTADSRGHFLTAGTINGRTVNFMVDTGATTIVFSAADATLIGIDLANATPVQMNTANGVVSGYRLQLASVRVGDVELYDIAATVSPQPMTYMLLGNSFLNRFSMRRDGDQMVLDKRY